MRVLIVDDEPLARSRLRRLIGQESDFVVSGEARDGIEALVAIRTSAPDVVFLDVQMPGLSGFQVIDSLGSADLPHVVFVTAFGEYAANAFDANAVDYLKKPFDNKRFQLTLEKLRKADPPHKWHRKVSAARAEMGSFATRLAVRHAGEYELVDVGDIDWISGRGNYCGLHIAGRARLLRCTLRDLEARLDPDAFVRVHRSTILNIDRVLTVRPRGAGFVLTLADGTQFVSSRSYRANVAALLR